MLFEFVGYLSDVKEIESKKVRKYLNGKLRVTPFDYEYLSVGIKVPFGHLPDHFFDNEHLYKVDVNQSWSDLPDGRKDCRFHFSVVSVK